MKPLKNSDNSIGFWDQHQERFSKEQLAVFYMVKFYKKLRAINIEKTFASEKLCLFLAIRISGLFIQNLATILRKNSYQLPVTMAVSVIRRDALCNTSGLTAPGSLNTCPMCKGQK